MKKNNQINRIQQQKFFRIEKILVQLNKNTNVIIKTKAF